MRFYFCGLACATLAGCMVGQAFCGHIIGSPGAAAFFVYNAIWCLTQPETRE